MEDEDGGLFAIEVSSDESAKASEKIPRDFQSEEDFARQRREWKVKVEKGEVCYWYDMAFCRCSYTWIDLGDAQITNRQPNEAREPDDLACY